MKPRYLYKPGKDTLPSGVFWAPSGRHFYVSEFVESFDLRFGPVAIARIESSTGSRLRKVSVADGSSVTILEAPTEIYFFMPQEPRSRNGPGAAKEPSYIVVGAKDGLWVMNGSGRERMKLVGVRPEGVGDVLWDPSGERRFLISFRQPVPSGSGDRPLKGVYLVDASRPCELEQLSAATDIHTLFFSPDGRRIAWATEDELSVRDSDLRKLARRVRLPEGKVKGFAWSPDGKKLAVAVDGQLVSYDLARAEHIQLAKAPAKTFIAHPVWSADGIVYTSYQRLK